MLNKAILIGRLTRDVELRNIPGGNSVGSFTLAVERAYKNRRGEREVDFIDVTVWRKLAELCSKHIGKGRLVAVAGSIQQDQWEQDGQKRSKHKVVADTVRFLDWPDDNGKQQGAAQGVGDIDDIDDDDLPF